MCRLPAAVLTICLLSGVFVAADAGDWPTYRGDLARSGASAEKLPAVLQPQWVYDAPSKPQLAWSSAEGRVIEGQLIGHRVKFDDAFHPVVAGERAYFGSSVDHRLHCVDLKSGRYRGKQILKPKED